MEAVKASYLQALDGQPDLIPAHTALVALQLLSEDVDGAKKQVQSLLKLRPTNAQARYLEALVATSSGQFDRARELTQQLIKTAPKNPKVLLLAGKTEANLGSHELANTYLTQAVSLDPDKGTPRRALAEFLLNRGQPLRALETLRPLTRRGSSDGQALVLQAQANLQLGNAKAADAAFIEASKIIPNDPNLRTVRAQALVERSADPSALADLFQAARNDRSPRGELALIAVHMRKGDWRQARSAADALAAKLPKSPLPDLLKGQIAELEKDEVTAERHFVAALGKDPRYIVALAALARLDSRGASLDGALSRVRSHLERHPESTETHLLLADLLQRQGKGADAKEQLSIAIKADPTNPAIHLAIIRRLERSGDTRGAVEAAKAAAAALPDNPDVAEALGAAQLQSGESLQAVATLNRLVGNRETASGWMLLAQAHDISGNVGKAEEAIRRAMKLTPDAPAVLHAAVLLAVKRQQFDRALSLSRQVQQTSPAEALGYRMEGDVFSAQSQWTKAIGSYRVALTKADMGATPSALHHALIRAGKQLEATAFEATWLRQHPDDAAFRLRLANLALERNDPDAAETGLRMVVAQRPDSVEALNNLAHVLVLRNKKGAVKIAQRAFNLAPHRADVVDTLAQAQAAEGQIDDAIETQILAKKLAPQAPLMHLNLVRLS